MNLVYLKTFFCRSFSCKFAAISLALAVTFCGDANALAKRKQSKESFEFSEGKVSQAVITAGPFDLHRQYRSMEGPYISFDFKVGEVLDSKAVNLPEGMAVFVENNGVAPAMMGGGACGANNNEAQGLIHNAQSSRSLLWLKGVKLEVLDENDKVMPTAEFICHWNVDVKPNFRNLVFSDGERCASVRLATVTQGQTEITFPAGYGVPVASDEPWNVVFQAANRTTDEHRRVKHRCTFYFIKDQDLIYPITSLAWHVPWIYVVIDKNSPQVAEAEKTNCPSCLGLATAVNAPNNTSNGVLTDRKGRRLSGHWVIPPGTHTYGCMINDEFEPGFAAKPRIVHTVWSHIHPLCSNLSLFECNGDLRKKMISVDAKTDTTHGLEIKHIDNWISEKGVCLPEKVNYELDVTYKNTTGVPQDSMAAAGIFFEDPTFARPQWVLAGKDGYACSVGANKDSQQVIVDSRNESEIVKTPQEIIDLPAFDAKKDGPILQEKKSMRLDTNAGPIIIKLDPQRAPMAASQIYHLLRSGAFNGTRLCTYQSNFMLQIAAAEDKAAGQPAINPQSSALLRRMPMETFSQPQNELSHRKHLLSMAKYDDKDDSAVSSFFILVADAPHLDHKFTIFGELSEDAATLETLAKIGKNWDPNKYWVVSVKAL